MEKENNEMKPRTMRLDNENYEKFRLLAEEFPNQAQALSALISVYEIEKSKAIMPERQMEIESFSVHVQKINELYNHALVLNQDAELRIRAEFERQLSSKDNVIQDLQEKLSKFSATKQDYELQGKQLIECQKRLEELVASKASDESVINGLTEITTEYRSHSKENETLKSTIRQLEKQNSDLLHQNSSLEKNIADGEHLNSFAIEKLRLEKDQEILKIKQLYSDTIDNVRNESQAKIKDLLLQLEINGKSVEVSHGESIDTVVDNSKKSKAVSKPKKSSATE